MENNLPTKYKEGIFSKISNFFKNIFKKKEVNVEKIELSTESTTDFKAEIQNKSNDELEYFKNMDKEQFVEEFEKNPELLNNLTVQQLEKLDKYYDEIIQEYELKLKKLA